MSIKSGEDDREKMVKFCKEVKRNFPIIYKEVMQKSALNNVELALPICLDGNGEVFLGEASFGTRYLSVLKDCDTGRIFSHPREILTNLFVRRCFSRC